MDRFKGVLIWIAIIGSAIFFFNFIERASQTRARVSINTFYKLLDEGKIVRASVSEGRVVFKTSQGQSLEVNFPKDYTDDVMEKLLQKGVKVNTLSRGAGSVGWLISLILSWLPIILFVGIWILLLRQMGGGGGVPRNAFSFGKSRAKVYIDEKPKVTFKDVAGIEEVKEEVKEIIEFLKDPARFKKLGGRPPKGVLLYGEPGVGKTLLAKAIAGEAHVPFISVSGSDFVEMFVGVGAARVRDLFETAKKHAPCIIFIDEIDAVGRTRGVINIGGNDEREQTLNQLLVEMDGFDTSEGIIVIAATNRPDILDPALLRPGRFDRQIFIPKPDVRGRFEILKVHAKNKKLSKDVDLMMVARATSGFTGADLENLLNEAALLAARKGKGEITMEEIEEALDRITMGLERKGMVLSLEQKEKIAYHETGHAIVSFLTEGSDPVHKVSVIPRGMALGVTQQLPIEDKYMYDKKEILAKVKTMLGGRVAEEVFYGKDGITTGAENDLQRATEIVYRMVSSWGMSERVGPISIRRDVNPFLRGGTEVMEVSEELMREIDEEVKRILEEAYKEVKEIIEQNKEVIRAIVKKLIEKETISCEEFAQTLKLYGVSIKTPCKEEREEKKEKELVK